MTNLQLVQDANFQVVHEVYDLLSDSNAFHIISNNGSDEWLLNKPSLTAPLRSIRFTQFKPIYKPGILSGTYTATVSINPLLVTYEAGSPGTYTATPITDIESGKLTSVKNGIGIPIRAQWQHTFMYNGSFEDMSHNINDSIDIYFNDLYKDGYIQYTDASSHVWRSPDTLTNISYNSYTKGLRYNVNTNIHYSLISFNNTNLGNDDVDDDGSNIYLTFIWVDLSYEGDSKFLIFALDIDCNNHAFSINSGALFSKFFDQEPPLLELLTNLYGADNYNACSYDDNLTTANRALIDSNMLISLCSDYAGNLTSKIFTGENIFQTVTIETFPSSMYFPITIRDKNNKALSVELLRSIYDQITLAVDYVYLTY